jgi:NAD(P)H-hydrate epimerase
MEKPFKTLIFEADLLKNKFNKMKIFTVKQIAELDRYTIENEPVQSVDLMERAAGELCRWVVDHTDFRSFTVFAGFGNNGGDGLVMARLLAEKQLKVNVVMLKSNRLSPDCEKNLKRLKRVSKVHFFKTGSKVPVINDCIIDALFGSGLTRPLSGEAAELVHVINNSGRYVISADTPSGLMGEDNSDNDLSAIVKANVTLSLQFPRLSCFFAENYAFTGKWYIIPIGLHPEAIEKTPTPYHYTREEDVCSLLMQRTTFGHKGTYGHALIMAGSRGKFGAAVLAARACVHAGAGLTTVFTSDEGLSILPTAVPEAMGIFDKRLPELKSFTAIAAGPGTGTGKEAALLLHSLLKKSRVPMILDADALNILAENKSWLKLLPAGTILSPHPGEFSRLAGKSSNSYEMLQKAISMAMKYKVIVVLKGAYTRVVMPGGDVYFNSSGNPGMAKGGSGDVLTGILVSLLARGYSPEDAAVIGVYLHGLSGDLAAKDLSQEYISAGDIISYLCPSFKKLYQP